MKPLLAVLLLTLPVSAASFVTGGQLLNQPNANQLATWLGQGDLNFTNIFSGAAGISSSAAFHAAVDGVGPTFILVQTDHGLIGGYDPSSWNSSTSYNFTVADADRTAFIFNLSTASILRQLLNGQGNPGSGQYQTFNYSFYGPTFGGGHDLAVNDSTLSSGYAYPYSYGNAGQTLNLFGSSGQTFFNVTRVEAYTFSAQAGAATPEPATFLLCGGALALLGVTRRKKR